MGSYLMSVSTTTNIPAAGFLFRELYFLDVREIVFCAGARNSPLVAVLAKTEGFVAHSFFEERSAAFFALGRARRDGRPVAVLTTSGTAAAELLPAVIEAFHTGVPLILVTADRPRRLRGTGAPQAIDQTGLFAKFVGFELDVEAGESWNLRGWDKTTPAHINLCFAEPLLDGPIEKLSFETHPYLLNSPLNSLSNQNQNQNADENSKLHLPLGDFQNTLLSFFQRARKPIVLVSTLSSETERQAVAKFLKTINAPVYAESTSGLRDDLSLHDLLLRSGERILNWMLQNNCVDSVLRLGGVPTARIWRDLDEPASTISVLSLSSLPFSGLSRGEFVRVDLEQLSDLMLPPATFEPVAYARLKRRDQQGFDFLQQLSNREPEAEPSFVKNLSNIIPPHALVYLGNSLPIRHWDLMAASKPPCQTTLDEGRQAETRWVQANRGVNGIDGQLSTFLGLLPKGGEGWAIVGDLTAMYDLTAPWALGTDPEAKVRIVVLNNGGGRIFSRIFQNELFENRHQINFAGWAAMWNFEYQIWREPPTAENVKALEKARLVILEIQPDEDATDRFWNAYDLDWSRQ